MATTPYESSSTPSTNINPSFSHLSATPGGTIAHQTPGELKEVFGDLEFRFLSNLPPSEFKSERLFFHLEQAWWLYEDELSDNHKHLPHFKFEDFAREFFKRSELLGQYRSQFDVMYMQFKEYQHRIPVYGGALLTADLQKVLLVTGFRSQNSWGFPKGKINQGEDELACAIREVYEETGFDAAYLNPKREDKMVWSQKNGKSITIFIIPGVPEDFQFAPRVVKEIDEIKWWKIKDLPRNSSTKTADAGKTNKNKFWGVSAFTSQLRKWIARRQNVPLPPGEDHSTGEEAGSSEEEVTGGGLGRGEGDFSVEEMFRVNKILREQELAQTAKQPSTKGGASQPKAKKDRESVNRQKQEKAKSVVQVTSIAINSNRGANKSNVFPLQHSTGQVFSVNFSLVSQAMKPFLAA